MKIARASWVVGAWMLLLPSWAAADGSWQKDGIVVCSQPNSQAAARVISVGSDQWIVVWQDQRSGQWDIYAQRINAQGQLLWDPAGKAVTNAAGDQVKPQAVAYGSGGALITWEDYRVDGVHSDLYAQRIDGLGDRVWNGDAVICSAAGSQTALAMTESQSGQVLLVWQDDRNGDWDLVLQRIDGAGNTRWSQGSGLVVKASSDQTRPQCLANGTGGVYVVWQDDELGNVDIAVKGVDQEGVMLPGWNMKGICTETHSQRNAVIASDGAGGIFVVWDDDRPVTNTDIYCQRVLATGSLAWPGNGVAVVTEWGNQNKPLAVPDKASGIIVAWEDDRYGNKDLGAQRISASGGRQWFAPGVAISVNSGDQVSAAVVDDGGGGLMAAWHDFRYGYVNPNPTAQRLNSAGERLWPADDTPYCNQGDAQINVAAARDLQGALCLVWEDNRNGNWDLFAQKIVRPNPRGKSVVPDQVPIGRTVQLTFGGEFFSDDRGHVIHAALTRTGKNVPATSCAVTSSTQAVLDFDLSALALPADLGAWSIAAWDSLGQTATGSVKLTLLEPRMQDLTWVSAPAIHVLTGTDNNLIGQINCHAQGYDQLTTLTLENVGTALAGRDILSMTLWHGPSGGGGGVTFNPSTAVKVGTMNPVAGTGLWQILPFLELSDGDALYVTAEISGEAALGRMIRLALSAGGCVFARAGALPAVALLSSTIQTISLSPGVEAWLQSGDGPNVLEGDADLFLGQLNLNSLRSNTLDVESVSWQVQSPEGNMLDPSQIFSRVWLEQAGVKLAEQMAPFGETRLVLTPAYSLPALGKAQLDIKGALLAGSPLSAFAFIFENELFINEGRILTAAQAPSVFPLQLGPFQIRRQALEDVCRPYPNPFRASQPLHIPFYAVTAGEARLQVYTLTGQLIQERSEPVLSAGVHEMIWDGRNQKGRLVQSGIYWIRLDISGSDSTPAKIQRRVALIR